MGSEEKAVIAERSKCYKIFFKYNLRKGVIFNGIMQSIFQTFVIIMSALALKVVLEMREKQKIDLQDHGADINDIENGNIPYKNVDIIRLWNAKQTNDFHIKFIAINIIVTPLYIVSCLLSIYGAFIKSRFLILTHCCCFVLYSIYCVFIFTYRTHFMNTEVHAIKVTQEGIYMTDEANNNDSLYSWWVAILSILYMLLTLYGTLTVWYYQLQLRDEAIMNGTETNESLTSKVYQRGTESMKQAIHSLKETYLRLKNNEPTPV